MDHTISAQKLQPLTPSRFVTSDASGYIISTKQYIVDSDFQNDTITSSKIANLEYNKLLNVPSTVSDISQLTNSTPKIGLLNCKSDNTIEFKPTIDNSFISGIDFTKIHSDINQANKFLKFSDQGVITTALQSTTVDFSGITGW